jgi:hypothetical protein
LNRVENFQTFVTQLIGEFDNQNTVFRGQSDEHHNTYLTI